MEPHLGSKVEYVQHRYSILEKNNVSIYVYIVIKIDTGHVLCLLSSFIMTLYFYKGVYKVPWVIQYS